ncbi:MAG: glycerol kinase GlpK [Hyphomicrobiales bacterium]|nr:glycerol kinase GlpK [Hyphomicrobiales bacterium]MBV8439027.1 glycerol kinase GlpK [Hyphomicrobiales bacterium]
MRAGVLVIDQGTTSTRSIVFDLDGAPVAAAQDEIPQIFPRPGWVEHDPESLWSSAVSTAREALRRAACEPADLAAIGVANQRETVLLWNRATGKPLGNAIVWQDRRTADACSALKASGCEPQVTAVTGLLLDPYFSATKIGWALDAFPGARGAAGRGELAFGTVDCFLLWRLTNGAVHATDATNASRTMLYDIRKGGWDDDMLRLFNVPASILPEVRDTAADYGVSAPEHFGVAVPVRALIGDQQSALIGQACVAPGMVKATYGTGGFLLLNIGDATTPSQNRLLTTVAYQWRGRRAYALEGSIFSAGATVQWLRDGLKIIAKAADAGELAAASDPAQTIYCVPAFAGLGAPHWSSEARALLCGITRGTTRNDIARAALESVGYQTRDLVEAMRSDAGGAIDVIRVDGGMAASDWTMQFLADILGVPVDRPRGLESTAQGAAFAAGWQAGLYPGPESFGDKRRRDRLFAPQMDESTRERLYLGWRDAVDRAL